ncbi:solute carrier family 28 member 3 isoform X3 [Oxyura jamaicensis]|uniref:solute carrier family 28 member 3 isoform X3 n=1 Tax=Oxyura jamaicensis TaxID=8884 RepID=UPI0015A669BB|nr:solute carrier family 28 member 3 isoform X3 [Oxyura jamaicensis]
MELKETTRDHAGVHNLAYQENEYINMESDLHENKHDSAAEEQPHLKGPLEKKYDKACDFCKKHKTRINYVIYGILITAYLAVVIAACSLNFQRAFPLLIITVLAVFFICWDFLVAKYEDRVAAFFSPGKRYLEKQWFWLKWVLCAALLITIILWLVFDTAKQGSRQMISFGGLVMYVVLMFIFSKYPARVAWRPVFSGIAMQFILGILILRTKVGFDVFNWLGIQIQTFLEYSDTGAKFVFGEKYTDHLFAFKISASHLLTASVMSAPASLATSKLFWPETEKPQVTLKSDLKMAKSESKNLLEAASQGASSSILLVANIAVNLISFLALLAFIDSALSWVGNLFDYPQLNFENICSYIFMPFSFMMGVDWEDSFIVGGLLGYKTFFNEFVAYERLSKLINNREKGGSMYINNVKQYMTVHSETIATYALCGFANFGSLGLVIGSLTSLAPSKRKEIAGGAFRAMIAGTVACFMTACIAGMLTVPGVDVPCHILLPKAFNSTSFPANSTEVLKCCQQLFTSANNTQESFLGGNYSLSSWKGCCEILNQPTFNCTWIKP